MLRASRSLSVLLIACALALRVWVPAGWMPTPGAHNFAIMPCPAADPAPVMHMGHGSGHHEHSKAGDPCFSPLLAGAALPDGPPVIDAPAELSSGQQATIASASFASGPPALPPPSTGPPLPA